jgi:histidine triad (HIT) family protein
MADCIFCRIAAKSVPAKLIAETPDAVAFHDLSPQAPVHALVIPRKHVATLNDLGPDDGALVGKLFLLAKEVAGKLGVAASGWRAVFNTGKDANQTVLHIHLHLLGGRALAWPPG